VARHAGKFRQKEGFMLDEAFLSEKLALWTAEIPDEQWKVYDDVIVEAQRRGLRFALGGAFSLATYTGHWRNTKDLDFYVLPAERDAMIEVLTFCGLQDYMPVLEYQPHWIYRSHCGDIIIDVIWAMANHRTDVDEAWLTRGPEVNVRGRELHIIPAEELFWGKLYILQRDRCDWPDLLNVINALGPDFDWKYFLGRIGDDVGLLRAVVATFEWLAPSRAQDLPDWLWKQLNLPRPQAVGCETEATRMNHIDSRPWFWREENKEAAKAA
jgi:hypothetical protein